MSVISGKSGQVSVDGLAGAACIRDWSVSHDSVDLPYVCSVTRGGTGRVVANDGWSGSFKGYGHTPPVKPGDSISFGGVITGANALEGAAIVEDVTITIDIEAGGIIEYEATFVSNGALTYTAASAITAPTSFPDPPSAKGCKAQVATPAASPSFSAITDVRKMVLKMMMPAEEYVSSETAGVKKHVATNFDAEVTIDAYYSDPSSAVLPKPNSTRHVRLFVDATTYWDIKWIMFQGFSTEVDRESGAIVGCTLKGKLNGFTNISATPTGGWIKNPAGTAWWDGST